MDESKIVIVTPVFEDIESARALICELSKRFGRARIVAIDDGSIREPLDEEFLLSAGMKGAVIRLRRNLGHQGAIAVGLSYVNERMDEYECVVIMDSDGEDRPDSLPELLRGFALSEAEVRVAQRRKRGEPIWFRYFYFMYKALFRMLTGKTITFGNYMALKPAALSRLTAMNEVWIHLAGAVIASKLRIEGVMIDRGSRYAGSSKMNFTSLMLHGLKGVMVFSEQVLIRMGALSLSVAALSVLISAVALVMKMIDATSPGWLTSVISATILIFLQTGVLTLIILMITGQLRASTLHHIDYKPFVQDLIELN